MSKLGIATDNPRKSRCRMGTGSLRFDPHPADQLHIVLPDRREGNSRFDRFQSGFEYPVDERTRQGRPAVRVGFEPASEHDLLAPRPRRFQHVERVNHAIGRNVNRRVRTDELGDAVIERADLRL